MTNYVHKQLVRLELRWALWIGVVQEVLDADENLLYGDRWPPSGSVVLVEDGETHGARWVDLTTKTLLLSHRSFAVKGRHIRLGGTGGR